MPDTGWYEVPTLEGVIYERIVGRTDVPSTFRVWEDEWEDTYPLRRTILELEVIDPTPADVTEVIL